MHPSHYQTLISGNMFNIGLFILAFLWDIPSVFMLTLASWAAAYAGGMVYQAAEETDSHTRHSILVVAYFAMFFLCIGSSTAAAYLVSNAYLAG